MTRSALHNLKIYFETMFSLIMGSIANPSNGRFDFARDWDTVVLRGLAD